MLKGFKAWDERRTAQEDKVEHLDWKRLERRSEFPSDLATSERRDLVLEYLREAPWAKQRIARHRKSVPQGSYLTLKRRGVIDSVVDVFAFALGLRFEGLEIHGDGVMRFHFQPDSRDNCQSNIVVELNTGATPFKAHRFRSDANVNPGDFGDGATAEFVEEQIGESVVAAWEERSPHGHRLCMLWSDGRLSLIRRYNDTIWINVVEDLRWVVEETPFADAIAVGVAE